MASKFRHHCLRCGGNWNSDVRVPKICQRCHSPLWNRKYTLPGKIGREK